MPALTLYGLKNCDTCKKALKALETAGRDVTFVDIRADADLNDKVPAWLAEAAQQSGGMDQLVNKRSTTWRGLSDAERADADTQDGAIKLLIAHPTLIKRPVIEAASDLHIGWSKDVASALGVS